MKHITKISTLLIALTLAMSASAATKYCEKDVQSNQGESGTLTFTASKTGEKETTFILTTNTSNNFRALDAKGTLFNVVLQDPGQGSTSTIWREGWTLENNTLTKVVTWTTYPTNPIRLLIVANRDNSKGGADIIGAEIADIDVSVSCDGSGDAGGSDVDEPETPVESTYCHELLISGNCTIYLTNEKLSENNYRLTIEGENLVDVQNTYYNPATTKLVPTSVTSEKIICDFTATSTPKFYTPLYIKTTTFDEVTFADIQNKDLIWGTCSATPEPIYNSISESICFGATYEWNGQTYSTAGEYTQEFTAVNGADSIVTLTLTVHPQTPDVTEDVTIDFGETYTWHNQEYTATGTYTTTLQDANGCDYQATLNLTVNSNSPSTPSTCTYEGGPGDGQTSGAGRQTFQSGYNIAMWLNTTKDSINIRLELLANDITDADNAYFHNYPTYSTITEIDQVGLTKESDGVFIGVIPISFISNNVDGIMRFGLKVEYPRGVIRVTTPEYFYLDGSGCAQRVFAIYHHDDLPAEPLKGEDQFTEFAGGKILQSIQYKRRMPSEVWETLSVPFDVDSVTAFDPATGEHVRLYAQYNNGSTQAGHYWLRYFKTPSVTRTDFQPNWYDIEATSQEAAKPEKDKAYIIRLPNGGGYYNDKYIVFHGRGYQEIADAYIAPSLPADDYYSYSGNNTMMPQSLTSAYVLDNAGVYFQSLPTVTLHPFECSVNATAATIAKMPRFALNGKDNTTTDLSDIPTTDYSQGVIYSIYGACVARFNSIEEYDHAYRTLLPGIYIVSTPSTTTKIQIP